jgi:hypothetical protein
MTSETREPSVSPAGAQEHRRLRDVREKDVPWRKWGPYLSERQWGTVREDYSESGSAWDYFTHDQARSRAYHWGEDGLAGVCDDAMRLCFAVALWNGADPILKERLFGLSNSEGNHGEDVKEYYFYLDSTPTHSYMKYLYKYPQRAYPYDNLVQVNRRRSKTDLEYELLNTGVFNDDRYFDVFVEYAKETPEDLLVRMTVHNRGPKSATLHVLPTLWFRNTWAWAEGQPKPLIEQAQSDKGMSIAAARHAELGDRFLYCEGDVPLLFTENETNNERIFGTPNRTRYVKDGINNYIVNGNRAAVNPDRAGSKASAMYKLTIGAGQSVVLRLRLTDIPPSACQKAYGGSGCNPFGKHFDEVFGARRDEADEFWASLAPPSVGEDARNVMRQALAGMLWSKQFYYFDVPKWLEEHGAGARSAARRAMRVRNADWFHMVNGDIISMPDKWEYPWFAAWDLAFHSVALSVADVDLAKQQLNLMLQHVYMHPCGQIPAYEWNFSNVNPPVHAWAAWLIYQSEKELRGKGDMRFLKDVFNKLLMNFTWWVNRKDRTGSNVFEGGFLGLDNIGVFDRSAPLPTGGYLDQSDGTAWMAFYCQCMLHISIELASDDPIYEELVLKFTEHFFWIAAAMDKIGEREDELWDEKDGFFYDVLRLPDGTAQRLKVRSLVGLLPLCAVTIIEEKVIRRCPQFLKQAKWFLERHPELVATVQPPGKVGVAGRRLFSILGEEKLRRVLSRMLDEKEFLSPFGIRSLSRYHAKHPFVFNVNGQDWHVKYLPAESDSGLFGGNSNWRGPIWMPVNALIVRALLNYYAYYGDDFKVECPTGSGRMMNLFEVSKDLADRLTSIFLRGPDGRRPVYGDQQKFQTDPHWRNHILFYEYFHGDCGAGVGASHQTGWTGIIAKLIQMYGDLDPRELLERAGTAAFRKASHAAAADGDK